MLGHLYINRLKILIRDKQLIFWTLIFPLVLGTLFNLAFSRIDDINKFETLQIAVINNQTYQEDHTFSQVLTAISEGEDPLFHLNIIDQEEEARKQLEEEKIEGYIIDGKLVVKGEGLDKTIMKSFLDQYHQKSAIMQVLVEKNNGNLTKEMIEDVLDTKESINHVSYSKQNPKSSVNYFYTLIAMACLYGGFWGVKEIRDIQANQSSRAARINLVPVHKLKILLSNLAATLTITFTSVLLLLAYLALGLKIDFGNQIGFLLLASFIGSMTGVSMGMCIGCVCKKGETLKTAVLLAVTMSCSFLAGMMIAEMKYIIASKLPLLGYINPANLLTDSLYALYYYDTYTRFALNLSILGVMIVIFLATSYFVIRRQKYEYI